METIKEAFPFLLAIAALGGCLNAASGFAEKRLYFSQLLNDVVDPEDREVINWYRNSLKNMIITQVAGGAGFTTVIILFADIITSGLNAPGNVLYRLLGFFIALVSIIIWWLRKSDQVTLEDSLQKDARPPVLYLRSFEQDGEAPLTIMDAVSPGSKKLFSYEDLAIGSAAMVGPVVAIASPLKGEKDVLGAAKGYAEDWQKSVREYMEQSSLIIMRPYGTEGVLWEFEQIVKLNYLHKTVLYIQLGGAETASKKEVFKQNESAYNWFKNKVYNDYHIDLGKFNAKAPITFFDTNNETYETNDYFAVPEFRKVFYKQYLKIKQPSDLSYLPEQIPSRS